MRPHKPTITTTKNGEAVEFVVRYESPTWASLVLSIREFAFGVVTIVLFVAGGYWLLTTSLGLTKGQIVVVVLAWLVGAWVIARVAVNLLADFRFGLLPGGDPGESHMT